MFVQKFFPPPNSETSIVMGNGTSCRGREGVDGQAGRRTGQTDRQTTPLTTTLPPPPRFKKAAAATLFLRLITRNCLNGAAAAGQRRADDNDCMISLGAADNGWNMGWEMGWVGPGVPVRWAGVAGCPTHVLNRIHEDIITLV